MLIYITWSLSNIMKKKSFEIIILCLISVIILVGIDQITKHWAASALSDNRSIPIIDNALELYYAENIGAAFSFLSGRQLFFKILTPIILIGIGYIFMRIPEGKRYIPLNIITVLLISGAIGNYIDRLLYSYVRDFIYFSLINFPIFNVADIYVTTSVIAMILFHLFYYKEKEIDDILGIKNGKA